MKDLTASVFTFEDLILGDYLYVDKTAHLWELVKGRKGIYFLSRPRRFGKSLTLSTLEAIFQGKRELFKGLAIDSKPYDWKRYPVIHLDFGDCAVQNAGELRDYLYFSLCSLAQAIGVQPFMDKSQLGLSLTNLINSMDKGDGVVVLVDEYDKPLLNMLGKPEAANEMLPVMKGFYSAIKKCEPHERFVFVTGVSKFCHVSLFSDLNNLQDISTSSRFATMLGYTQKELEANFDDRLPQAQEKLAISQEELLRRLKLWYDGYRFAPDAETVYNPVSIANFFMNDGLFSNYWFSTGTASSLFALMRRDDVGLPDIVEHSVAGDLFNSFDLAEVDLQKLMYQTGYLTIGETEIIGAGTEEMEQRYHLRFPNKEVRSSFNDQIMDHFAGLKRAQSSDLTRLLVADIRSGDVNAFMERLRGLFAKIPYDLHGRRERDYQTILYVVFLMLEVFIQGEYHTNEGRIDLVLSVEEWTYVVELKLNRSAEKAMAQIWDRDYVRGFLGQNRRIMAVGVNFDETRAQIDNWLAEEVTE
ncbi:MAG: ATP-binding protein [Lentisphaeria bacterium]|nr:ATP-binding protein [Lentisphaeria bacterium]